MVDTPRPAAAADLRLAACGGVVGASARWGLVTWAAPASVFPWTTLGINVAGSAAIGVVLALIAGAPERRPWLRPLVATGVLGGFTTMSGFAVETDQLVSSGRGVLAALYAACSIFLGLGTAGIASWAVRRRQRVRPT